MTATPTPSTESTESTRYRNDAGNRPNRRSRSVLRRNKLGGRETSEDRLHRVSLIRDLTFEVVPLNSFDEAVPALPPHSTVSVTCSPVKGIAVTMELTNQVMNRGHVAIPHISARMVESRAHATEIARWLRTEGIGRMFLVGGDANPPHGPYHAAADFLQDLLDADPGLHTIGVTGYPDGHAVIDEQLLRHAILAKQQLLADAGVAGYVSTQMCFDPQRIAAWLEDQRAGGLELPVHLGIAGVVDRTKLMTMGARLGIGTSLGYLRKNRKAISKLMTQSGYDPNDLLEPLSPVLRSLKVDGIHCFTFNQVAATEAWRQSVIA